MRQGKSSRAGAGAKVWRNELLRTQGRRSSCSFSASSLEITRPLFPSSPMCASPELQRMSTPSPAWIVTKSLSPRRWNPGQGPNATANFLDSFRIWSPAAALVLLRGHSALVSSHDNHCQVFWEERRLRSCKSPRRQCYLPRLSSASDESDPEADPGPPGARCSRDVARKGRTGGAISPSALSVLMHSTPSPKKHSTASSFSARL